MLYVQVVDSSGKMHRAYEMFYISVVAARLNAGLTQEELAKELKTSKSKIVRVEKGETKYTIDQMKKLSNLSGIHLDFLCP